MRKHTTDTALLRASLGNTVLMAVGKANGLNTGQLRALLGIAGLRASGLRVSAPLCASLCQLTPRAGRTYVYELIALCLVERAKVGRGKQERDTLELTSAGRAIVSQYERAERAAMRAFRA